MHQEPADAGGTVSCPEGLPEDPWPKPVDEQKEKGSAPGPAQLCEGNPCNPITGNKFEIETDYVSAGPYPLRFERVYNSERAGAEFAGADWRHWYQRSIVAAPTAEGAEALVYRADGQVLTFTFGAAGWASDPDVVLSLTELTDASGARTGWALVDVDDTVEVYDAAGRLLSLTSRDGFTQQLAYDAGGRLSQVVGPFGRTLTFTHTPGGRIETLTDPAGNVYRYAYDALENLVSVTYPDATPADLTDNPVRRYHYEDPAFAYHLTGITDANGNRFATFAYDAEGRAVLSERAGGVNRIEIQYNADGTSTVTDALGHVSNREAEPIFGVRKMIGVSEPCALCNQRSASMSYDANGFIASRTDFNGHVTLFQHDARGLEVTRTEAAGTADERTVTTEWHPQFRLPVKVTEPGRETTFSYDGQGRLLARTVTDTATGESRTTTRSYTPDGLLLSLDGPRTDVADVTTFEYDSGGNLVRTTNALGHVTQITAHDAHGRPLTVVDPNGAVTELRYDARGRLTSREVAGSLTTFDYDPAGNLLRTTLPDGSFIENTYDAAQRLVALEDNLGNRLEYTLDALGNRVEARTFDGQGTLRRTLSRVYNVLNRLTTAIGGANQTTSFAYDVQGNVVSVTDPNNHATLSAYDALNRLIETTAPDGGVTGFGYDDRDNLTSVTDPRGLNTTYTYNGFDEVVETVSPDTGLTTQNYDAAGNRVSQTDARGVTATYSYDALNRLTAITYPDASENVSFVYDEGVNGLGRLTTIVDASGTWQRRYDARGNVVEETRTVADVTLVTGYAYDAADRRTAITYPGGLLVSYTRDALGRVASVAATLGTQTFDVIGEAEYAPFGPATGWVFGNGLTLERTLDPDYRLTSQRTLPVQSLDFSYDAAGNIVAIDDGVDPARSQTFGYDAADRLTSAQGVYGTRDYSYDVLGNRLSKTADGQSDTYQYAAAANQLESVSGANAETFTYDAAGNTVAKGPLSFAYNDANRLTSVSASGQAVASYLYNHRGERVAKTVAGVTRHFHYDLQGNLIGEFVPGGVLRAYVYVGAERAALLEFGAGGPSGIFYFHNDHLGTPKALTDKNGKLKWQAAHTPFGTALVSLAKVENHLRFPGQYFDSETGLHYNYFRDYDPGIGRYIESDPIGIGGGVDTYSYVLNNPVAYLDPEGLCPRTIDSGVFLSEDTRDTGTPCMITQDRGQFVGTLIRSEGACECSQGKTCIYELVFKSGNRRRPCSGPWSPWKEFPDRKLGELRAPFECATGELILEGFSLRR